MNHEAPARKQGAATRRAGALGLLWAAALLAGCNTVAPYRNAAFNVAVAASAPSAAAGTSASTPRYSFHVDGERGNRKVLFFLALSGGGSRAAYFSAATMLALQSRLPADLLAEVDVVSSVSGGSMAAAYFAASRDTALSDPALLARLQPLLAQQPPPLPRLALDANGRLTCRGELTEPESALLRTALRAAAGDRDMLAIEQLCLSSQFPPWEPQPVLEAMRTDYLRLWIGNWFWPANVLRYWTTSFDRSDIMAQTLANNLYSRPGLASLGRGELKLSDLNPERPFLIINATNATNQRHSDGTLDDFPFGSVFTFTQDDFIDRLCSDAGSYSLARAVMGSSAFPLVFASMTLEDFRPQAPAAPSPCRPRGPIADQERRFLHVFDGGNSDNLGLRSVKRALLQLEVDGRLEAYDRIVVLLVDAFTTPRGADRDKPDPRSLISLLVDTNVSDAVDSLLQTNRSGLLAEFDEAQLKFLSDCGQGEAGLRQLPPALCQALQRHESKRIASVAGEKKGQLQPALDLSDRLVFFHFGFEDVERYGAEGVELRRDLDRIPTSFRIAGSDARLIDQAVAMVIQPEQPCLKALVDLVRQTGPAAPGEVAEARRQCKQSEAGRTVVGSAAP